MGLSTKSVALRENHRLTVIKNKLLMRIFGRRKLHDENNFYSSSSIIMVIKTKTKWVVHVARIGTGEIHMIFLPGKPEEKKPREISTV